MDKTTRPAGSKQPGQTVPAFVACPRCGREMRLFGIEVESDERDLYSFECERCDETAVRGVRVTPDSG